jgi:cell division protein FtsB
MPVPAAFLKLKRFRRRFGITAPKVVVRHHISWHWYVAGALLVAMLAGSLAWVLVQRGEAGQMSAEIESLRARVSSDQEELRHLRSTAGTGENLAVLERSTQQQLLARIRLLEAENAALKEEGLLFERLMAQPGEESALHIESVKVFQEMGAKYRYRIFLAFRPSKQQPEFRGRFQLRINYLVDGSSRDRLLPGKAERSAEYQVSVRHFLRKEGVFELPAGARLQSFEVGVFQGDTLKVEQVVRF